MALICGTHLGRYQIMECIGAGGMGEVYLAYDPGLDRRVAVKILPERLAADAVARERLRREALAAAALDHPFICKLFELTQEAGTVFLVMEYIRGETLLTRLRAARLSVSEAMRIAGEIAEAIEEAHANSLVHRDLKPANIMLTGQSRVKVMDFGLARKSVSGEVGQTLTTDEAQLTAQGVAVGTPDYMSPEQLTGAPLDQRSDLFSFGIILCEMLTGKHPFQRSSTIQTMTAILRDPPDLSVASSSELSPGLMVLIRRLLAKSPQERYPSMRDVRADLAGLAVQSAAAESHKEVKRLTPLIGREQEWAEVLRLLDAALAGRGSLMLIGGEPGIGKTHLTRAIVSEAARRGCFTVVGHCDEMEGAPPYVPFTEMLEYCARVAPRESLRYSLGDAAPEVAKLMPGLRRIFPDIPPPIELPPEQQRRFLFNAYCEFVERSARLTPIVAVFEDLHWADEPTLLLFKHLAQAAATMPMLMVGTYRDVDLDVTRPFAGVLESSIREKLATRLSLRRLGASGVQAMLTALSGQASPPSLVQTVFDETEGNPFFVEEVFQYLKEQGKLFDQRGAWRSGLRADELQVPQGVRLVIGRRLERLREETRRVLTTAAVIGRSFNLRLLEDLESARPDAALDALDEAERAQLVAVERAGREMRYRFVHELVRQTLAEALSMPRRQRLHARVADAIERLYCASLESHASALAHHLYNAGVVADLDKTITYLIMAARLASASAAHEEALAHIDNALSLVEAEQHPRTAELHAARAVALRSLARAAEAAEAYERAIASFVEAGNLVGAAEASFHLAYIHLWNADGLRGCAVADRAVRLIGTQPSPLLHRLLLLKAVGLAILGDMEASFAALSEAKQIEAALPESPADGFASMCEARVRFQAAQIQRADECGREALVHFRALGNLWGEAEIFEPLAAALWLGRPTEVEALLRDSLSRAERIGHGNAVWAYKSFSTQMLMAGGDLEGADRAGRDAHEFGRAISAAWAFVDFVVLGAIAHYRGDLDEACAQFQRGMEIEPRTYQSGQLPGGLFWTLAAKGGAGADVPLAQARLFLPIPGGRLEEAAALEPSAEHVVANGPLCVYSQHLFRTSAGIAAASAHNWTRAEEHHRIAIHQADSAPYRVAQPIARYWYADMLLSRKMPGDKERARKLLSETLALHESIGMPWHAHRTADRIAAL